MLISVLVASYLRPKDLLRCLEGLASQSRPADDVVVVLRDSDQQSWLAIKSAHQQIPLRILSVKQPGVLAANNLALKQIQSDIVCFIDDDACPHRDWIERIEKNFQDSKLGALGGRDRFAHPLMLEETEKSTHEVGKIRWYGKIINMHHRKFPFVAPADTLKGCNMSFRRNLLPLCDEGLIGNACYYEMDLCFQIKKSSYQILFDGNLVVDHYLSETHLDNFKRGTLHPNRVYNDYYNRSRVLLKHIHGPRKLVVAFYWLVWEPGTSILRFLWHKYPTPFACWHSAISGSWKGYLSLLQRL